MKIKSRLQCSQRKRNEYSLRAKREIDRGDYAEFEVILCSPEHYHDTQPEARSFSRFVSYEAIAAFLRHRERSLRSIYRANFIETAALKNANTWTKIDDETTKIFWNEAYKIATTEFPIVEMKKPDFTKDNTWLELRPSDMPTNPQDVRIFLKGNRGFVDLTFARSNAVKFEPQVAPLLEPDMTIHKTGKSAAIRIRVEGFTISERLEVNKLKVRAAFTAAERLIRFYRTRRDTLDRAAAASII